MQPFLNNFCLIGVFITQNTFIMRKILPLTLISILLFASNSCKKHDSTTIQDPIVPFDAGITITTVVAGKITDQTGAALNNVQITIGSTTTTTDINGSFMIPKATLSSKVGFIKATKDGYFAGSRTIMPKEKVINNIVIQLVKKTTSGSFSNANGGTITVATGGSIVFGANAIALKNGGAYTGTVKVSAYFLDPTSNDCYKEMPGDLRGINAGNNEQVLTSYGMMAVELQGSNGEALQLATGKTATLTFPIVAATQSKAPATIPLWFFDETKGMWIEQGTATKTGNNYVGTVSHFTWWNCDWGGGPITLTATFVDQNGSPLSNYKIYYITNLGYNGGGGVGFSESDGSLTGAVPVNIPIVIKIEDKCTTGVLVIYTATVGPFTQNTNLGNITVNIPTTNSITIKGTVLDCINNPVANGYAVIHFDNSVYYTYINLGKFSQTINYCSIVPTGIAKVEVLDLATLKQNATSATANITGAGVFNLGQINACGLQAFIKYTATFVDQNGAGLNSQYYVHFSGDTTSYYSQNYSPQNGIINATIPANKTLTRTIHTYNPCGDYVLIDSTMLTPFSGDFNAGLITVNIPQANTLTISGNATDCSNNPITNGFAFINIDGKNYTSSITNGNFSQQILRCSLSPTTAVISIVDNINQQQNLVPINATVTNNNISVGSIQACGLSTAEFFSYNLDNTTYNMDTLTAFKNDLNTYVRGAAINPYNYFSANFQGVALGTYSFYSNFTANNVNYADTYIMTVTEYGVVGQYIAGNFSGTVKSQGNLLPISATFRIRRTQ